MADIGALMTGVMHTMRWILGFFGVKLNTHIRKVNG